MRKIKSMTESEHIAYQKERGLVFINSEEIHFESREYGNWKINPNRVAIVGEYTTEEGPMLEDWFVVLITDSGDAFECPASAYGVDEMLQALEKYLNATLIRKLICSTDFSSRIMAPSSVEGCPLYSFVPVKESLWRKIGRFGLGLVERRFSENVNLFLAS